MHPVFLEREHPAPKTEWICHQDPPVGRSVHETNLTLRGRPRRRSRHECCRSDRFPRTGLDRRQNSTRRGIRRHGGRKGLRQKVPAPGRGQPNSPGLTIPLGQFRHSPRRKLPAPVQLNPVLGMSVRCHRRIRLLCGLAASFRASPAAAAYSDRCLPYPSESPRPDRWH